MIANTRRYDAIVLDAMLPGLDGFATCRELRSRGVGTPALLLTAETRSWTASPGSTSAPTIASRSSSFAELLARLRALVRRTPGERPTTLRIDDLRRDSRSPSSATARFPDAVRRPDRRRRSELPTRPDRRSGADRTRARAARQSGGRGLPDPRPPDSPYLAMSSPSFRSPRRTRGRRERRRAGTLIAPVVLVAGAIAVAAYGLVGTGGSPPARHVRHRAGVPAAPTSRKSARRSDPPTPAQTVLGLPPVSPARFRDTC